MSYNGWSNKETWLVNLWVGDFLTMDQEDGITIDAAYIEQVVEDRIEESGSRVNGFVGDILNCALCEIDYHELASHYEEEE
tara:strand:+ start:175 stop:417 length:243 start_codon:yes stop_codon:yes gene_type:complete